MQLANESDPQPTQQHEAADQILHEAAEQQLINEAQRAEMAGRIARIRWSLATTHHRLENGELLDFERWPFQKEIYQQDAQDLTIVSSAGLGKSEMLLVDAIASAICGLRVFYVFESAHVREKVVLGRLDPRLHAIPFYREMLEAAKQKAGGEAVDSARFKHFGDGSVNFVGSNSESEFFTHRADGVSIDEHQLCEATNLRKVFHRMSGSPWRFIRRVGNPKAIGTAENQNLDWEFRQSDMRKWNVPCPYCYVRQELGWWSHFVQEQKNEYGAILNVSVRDPEWSDDKATEFRPICTNCQRPMVRLNKRGEWMPLHPGRRKRGYQLSNLYNPDISVIELLEFYRKGLHDPMAMADFVNNQLGLAYNTEGSSITDDMLQAASTGVAAGIPPYRFFPARNIVWRPHDN